MIFHKQAKKDLEQIRKSGNIVMQKRLTRILQDINKHPYSGIAQPEKLKHNLSGWWSSRLTGEHRIVYRLENDGNIHFFVTLISL